MPIDCVPDDGRRAALLHHHYETESDHLGVAEDAHRLCAGGERAQHGGAHGDFTNVPGGFPITVNGQVIGAVAAGGAKIEQDVLVAQAALAALDIPDA